MKLYYVYSTLKSQKYGDLTIHWFVDKRPVQRDCKAFGADEANCYQKFYVDELFSAEEAAQFQEYLKRVHGDESKLVAAELPPKDNIMGYGAIGEGGGDRLITPSKEKDSYDLPFQVCGHYYLFEHQDSEEDPDFDFVITHDGMVQTAGGDFVGMSEPGNDLPLGLMIDAIEKKKSNPQDPPK